MACSDCEDCSKHIDSGGKCARYEYDCPFRHLMAYSLEEKIKIDEDIKVALRFKTELKELVDKYENEFNDSSNYEDVLNQIKFAHSELEDLTDEDLLKEWDEINTD